MLHAATRFFAWGLITGALLSIVGAVQGQDTPCDYRIVEWGSASNAQAGAYFGDSVSISGLALAVGAPLAPGPRPEAQGAVYMYRSTYGVRWDEQAMLLPPASLSGVRFGDSVALADDVLVVGASDATDTAQGAACVYRYNATAWALEATLVASSGAPGAQFGVAVALGPDVVAVGAPYAGAESGAAYVFRRTGGVWAQEAKLTAGDGAAGDHFGWSVAIHGEALLVGAPDDDHVGQDSGSAYVFRYDASGWAQERKLTAAHGAANDRFGISVALRADLALVAAPTELEGTLVGVAYVYRRNISGWSEEAQLKAEAAARFGQVSVALGDDLALVGAYGGAQGDDLDGRAWAWHFDGSSWALFARLGRIDASERSLGSSVALDGDNAVVGAIRQSPFLWDAGSFYVFRGLSADCNGNGVPDGCDIADGSSADCNGSGWPDECDIATGTSPDCNGNGVPDECDLNYADRFDCNDNGAIDACEIAAGTSLDCNANGVPDECETDCNGNGAFDECDIADGTSADCNANGVPDECDLAFGVSQDCNRNGIPDECDIAAGTSQDTIVSGIPDECVTDACPMACQLAETSQVRDPATTAVVGEFGAPLAISGSVLAVGAVKHGRGGGGNAYIYRRNSGVWAWESTLTLATENLSGMVLALALDGDTLVVGSSDGADYEDYWTLIYHYADGAWTREASFNHLGLAVALDGEVALVVSSYGYQKKPYECYGDEPPPECAVLRPWLYRRQEGTWVLESRLEVSQPGVAYYDIAAALSGNTAAVSVTGQWHLFQYDGSDWIEGATLPGGSLSIDGDRLALGGMMQAAIYEYDGSAWNLTTTLNAACADAGFGGIVQLRGDTLLVSSRYAVHAFLRHDGTWSEKARLTPGDGTYAIRALAFDAGTAVVSVGVEAGKTVYVFDNLDDQAGNGVLDACEFPWNLDGLVQCGAGACGAGVLGWLPVTMLGVGALKFRCVRRTRG